MNGAIRAGDLQGLGAGEMLDALADRACICDTESYTEHAAELEEGDSLLLLKDGAFE